MALEIDNERQFNSFVGFNTPRENGYIGSFLNFVALKGPKSHTLLRARLFLGVLPFDKAIKPPFESESVHAGQYSLQQLKVDYHSLLNSLRKGGIQTPIGKLELQAPGTQEIVYQPFHAEGMQNQSRLPVLSVRTNFDLSSAKATELDWELRAANVPYVSLRELLLEYEVGLLEPGKSTVEVVALQVALIDSSSIIKGTNAEVFVRLGRSFDPHHVSFGYRMLLNGKVVKRARIDGASFDWTEKDSYWLGKLSLRAEQGTILHGIVNYMNFAQHYWWITDPETSQNSRAAVFNKFDFNLSTFKDFLAKEGRGTSRDLEFGVSWLLWLLGFSPAHLGGTSKTQDAPDILAVTPRGRWLVIECTTGLLNADRKLHNLNDRYLAVKRALADSGHGTSSVIPVIVTTKSQAEIESEMDGARKMGMAVVTRELLEQLTIRALAPVDADVLFDELESELATKN